jgi:hypothetical protein
MAHYEFIKDAQERVVEPDDILQVIQEQTQGVQAAVLSIDFRNPWLRDSVTSMAAFVVLIFMLRFLQNIYYSLKM